MKVFARRIISPTFGIDSELLLPDERQVLVIGHGVCLDGERFKLRVTVTKESTGARAKGSTEGDCDEAGFEWEVVAAVQGPEPLQDGPAQVCAMAVVLNQREGAIVQKWCKEVILNS